MKGDVKNTYRSGAEKGVLCGSAESQGLFFSASKKALTAPGDIFLSYMLLFFVQFLSIQREEHKGFHSLEVILVK